MNEINLKRLNVYYVFDKFSDIDCCRSGAYKLTMYLISDKDEE